MRLKEERYRFLGFAGRAEVAASLGRALEDAGSGMVVVGRDKASATMEVVAGLGVTGSARRNGKCLLLVRHLPRLLFSSLPLFRARCHFQFILLFLLLLLLRLLLLLLPPSPPHPLPSPPLRNRRDLTIRNLLWVPDRAARVHVLTNTPMLVSRGRPLCYVIAVF